jgi:N-acetylmuramoyl-L-alanine amidase
VLHHPDGSAQAADANAFSADCYLGVQLRTDPGCAASYFGTPRWESPGGRILAGHVVEELTAAAVLDGEGTCRAMAVPVLRETRMPAVLCEVGPPAVVVARLAELADGLGRAVSRWAEAPLDL